jgi:glutamate dehydrogenase/leucine dehydrogenase
MRACAAERFGSPDLAGRRIVIAGVGHVGEKLARSLSERGAELVLCDIDPGRRALAAELGAEWSDAPGELRIECDILAPCALGGTVSAETLPLLRCEVVCGCANNQLADEDLADALADRGILYAPDFIVNAGGLIHVYREIRGYSEEHARELALGIEDTIRGVLRAARERGMTPLRAARELARERLEAPAAA